MKTSQSSFLSFRLLNSLIFATSLVFISSASMAQNNPLTTGGSNSGVEDVNYINATNINFVTEKKVEVEILKRVSGSSSGFKFVPLLPFLPRYTPGVININAKEIRAERRALEQAGGDVLLDKKIERTYTGILLIIWIEEIEVTGLAAKIKS